MMLIKLALALKISLLFVCSASDSSDEYDRHDLEMLEGDVDIIRLRAPRLATRPGLPCCEFIPTINVTDTTDNSITIEWSIPPEELQDCSCDFRVYRRPYGWGRPEWEVNVGNTTNSYVFENLRSATTYEIRIGLCSRMFALWCQRSITHRVETSPKVITVLTTTSRSISIIWHSAFIHDESRVRATCEGKTVGPFVVSKTATSYVFEGLKAECYYHVQVEKKLLGSDWGTLGETRVLTIDRDPEFIPNIFVVATSDSSISIEWSMPPPELRDRVRRYKLLATNGHGVRQPIYFPATTRSHEFRNLWSYNFYTIQIAACGDYETQCGNWSAEEKVVTRKPVEDFAITLAAIATTNHSIKIEWSIVVLGLQESRMYNRVVASHWDQIVGSFDVPGEENSFVFEHLMPETSYQIRVAVRLKDEAFPKSFIKWSREEEVLTKNRVRLFRSRERRLIRWGADDWSRNKSYEILFIDTRFIPKVWKKERTLHSITIGWSTPPAELRDYTHRYKVMASHRNGTTGLIHLDRSRDSYMFENLTAETSYLFKVAACSDDTRICGNWSSELEVFTISEEEGTSNNTVIGLSVAVILLGIVIIGMVIRRHRRNVSKKKLMEEALRQFHVEAPDCLDLELNMAERAELLPYNKKWEYPRELLQLGKILGSGAFGIVRKGLAKSILRNQNTTIVAVKMVLATNRLSYMEALTRELKILAYLGKHVNIVNLLGACTGRVSYGELLVIVEYCRFGNMRNYLIRSRAEFLDQVDVVTENIPDSSSDTEDAVEVNGSDLNAAIDDGCLATEARADDIDPGNPIPAADDCESGNEPGEPNFRSRYNGDYAELKLEPIGTRDLLSWTWQVSRGMRYLGERRILHGDLAARNILLADRNVVKICDFGMATALYKEENFKKKGHGPLPVKWMAIESLKDRIFSVKSDVWSYGVVLWEIFSLGETPYPGILQEHVRQVLTDGYRMPRPKYAPQDMYQIMQTCWDENPLNRPSFQKLEESIAPLLEESVKLFYVDMGEEYLDLDEDSLASEDRDDSVINPSRSQHTDGDTIEETAP